MATGTDSPKRYYSIIECPMIDKGNILDPENEVRSGKTGRRMKKSQGLSTQLKTFLLNADETQ